MTRPAAARRARDSSVGTPCVGRTTPRHGVRRSSSGAICVSSRHWCADSRPSGTCTERPVPMTPGDGPSVRPVSRVRRSWRMPTAVRCRPSTSSNSPPGRPSSSTRQTRAPLVRAASRKVSAAISAARAASSAQTCSASPAAPRPSCAPPSAAARTVTSAPSPATSPRPSSSANRKRPDRARAASLAHSAASRAVSQGRTSSTPRPSRPDSGEATTLRTRSWPCEGSSPAASSSPANSPPQPPSRPRSCTFPREVRCSSPSPSRSAASTSVSACRTVRTPPGIRTRASAPSSAACSRSVPGQASPRSRETTVAWGVERRAGVGMAASIPTITPGVLPALFPCPLL